MANDDEPVTRDGALAALQDLLVPSVLRRRLGARLLLSFALVAALLVATGVAVAAWVLPAVGNDPSTRRVVTGGLVALVGASLGGLVLLGLLVRRQVVVPLSRLDGRAGALQTGDLAVDLPTARDDEFGRLAGALATLRDEVDGQLQSTRAARDRARRHERRLEQRAGRLEQVASTVSHDLRNPLTAARGYLELAVADLEDVARTDDDGREDRGTADDVDLAETLARLEGVDEAHRRIESIVEDVLVLAREEAAVDPAPAVDLAAVAREAWDGVETRDAALTVDDTTTVEADRARLRRAFTNLFRNAVEHGGADVAVIVGLTEDGFYVADDGPGIPADETDAVFEFGYTTGESGTGLGLALVESIASAHGWTVEVDAGYDGGTRIVFGDVFEPA